MDKAKTEESIDQPIEESTEDVEQPVEESEDQPTSESEEGEEEVVEETTDEEDDIVELPDGTKLPKDELVKGYMRTSDYTRKTQELKKLKESMAQSVAPKGEEEEISEEEKAALSTLERLGVARKGDVETTVRRILAQQAIATERTSVQGKTGLDDDSMDIAQFIAYKRGIPLSKAAESLADTGKRVIKRKSLSPSSDVTTSANTKVGKEITPEYIKGLDPDSKEFEEVVQMMENGELQ